MKRFLLILFCLGLFYMYTPESIFAGVTGNVPPPPASVEKQDKNHGPFGDGASLGEGSWILVTLVIGYGVHTFTSRRKDQDQDIDLEE